MLSRRHSHQSSVRPTALNPDVSHGATDEIGFHAVENRHYVTDLHATVLHQIGLESRKLEIPGRKRLEIDFGKPIRDILL
jgi:hypothetical protein